TKRERERLTNRSGAGSSRNSLLQQPASAVVARRNTAAVPVGAGNEANLHTAPVGVGNPRATTVDKASCRLHPAAASTVRPRTSPSASL
ncbi:hypothetical protein PIB30_095414, partial [Stylosanthes scabra]|nr:hypothetical protein [Stylosanthes scabra]